MHYPTPPATAPLPSCPAAQLPCPYPWDSVTDSLLPWGLDVGPSCNLRSLVPPNPAISRALCPPILQSLGPCAPNPATIRAVCPQCLLSLWLSHHLHAPPHPPVVVSEASMPLTCLPYSLLLGVIPPPIQSRKSSLPRPSSIVRQSPPTHLVSWCISALPVVTGAL